MRRGIRFSTYLLRTQEKKYYHHYTQERKVQTLQQFHQRAINRHYCTYIFRKCNVSATYYKNISLTIENWLLLIELFQIPHRLDVSKTIITDLMIVKKLEINSKADWTNKDQNQNEKNKEITMKSQWNRMQTNPKLSNCRYFHSQCVFLF